MPCLRASATALRCLSMSTPSLLKSLEDGVGARLEADVEDLEIGSGQGLHQVVVEQVGADEGGVFDPLVQAALAHRLGQAQHAPAIHGEQVIIEVDRRGVVLAAHQLQLAQDVIVAGRAILAAPVDDGAAKGAIEGQPRLVRS